MDETELGNEVDYTVLLRYLHGDGEVVGSFGREEDINRFLLEWRIGSLMTDFDNMQLKILARGQA